MHGNHCIVTFCIFAILVWSFLVVWSLLTLCSLEFSLVHIFPLFCTLNNCLALFVSMSSSVVARNNCTCNFSILLM